MASRKEEKERLRQERLEREAAEQKKAAAKKRLQLVFGVLLAVAAVAVVVVVVVVGLGGSDDKKGAPKSPSKVADTKAPTANIKDLNAAAKQADCSLKVGLPDEGRNHETKTFTEKDYKQNPPTSGAHYPEYPDDGVFDPGNEPQLGMLVHTLEHGRIDIQYKPGTSATVVKQLAGLMNENGGYHQLLFQNPTNMPYQIAATAWDQQLGCNTVTPAAFDAIRDFRTKFTDHGPETVP